jgi:hypothetical protein
METDPLRRTTLEQKHNIRLASTQNNPDLYQLSTNGVQKVFVGLPIVFTLDQIEELIPQLDETMPDWRE